MTLRVQGKHLIPADRGAFLVVVLPQVAAVHQTGLRHICEYLIYLKRKNSIIILYKYIYIYIYT